MPHTLSLTLVKEKRLEKTTKRLYHTTCDEMELLYLCFQQSHSYIVEHYSTFRYYLTQFRGTEDFYKRFASQVTYFVNIMFTALAMRYATTKILKSKFVAGLESLLHSRKIDFLYIVHLS